MRLGRTLWVRTVFNEGDHPPLVRRLTTLLALLFLMPALSGCLGGSPVDWGDGVGEYQAILDEDAMTVTITSKLASSKGSHVIDAQQDLISCNGEPFELSGWLAQTRTFEAPAGNYKSVTSWMIMEKPYEEAKDIVPGTIHVTIVSPEKDWSSPTAAYALPPNKADRKAFPHDDWALIGVIPTSANVLEAAMMMDTNQAVLVEGYLVAGTGGQTTTGPLPPTREDCSMNLGNEGWNGHFVITSMTYGSNDRAVTSDEAYVAGDIPMVGRGVYTVVLLLSAVAAVAMFIFSRNTLIMGADEQAQSMLSDQQMRAGKAAAIEAERHEARMRSQAAVREAAAKGKRAPKGASAAPRFDIGAALAQGDAGETSHYVAGTGAVATEDAVHMEEMIHEMQEDLAMEQQLQEKGLRGIVSDLQSSGPARGGRVTSRVSGGVSSLPAGGPVAREPEPDPAPASRKTRKTRKTAKRREDPFEELESEPEPEPARTSTTPEGPDIADDEEFSDFTF